MNIGQQVMVEGLNKYTGDIVEVNDTTGTVKVKAYYDGKVREHPQSLVYRTGFEVDGTWDMYKRRMGC